MNDFEQKQADRQARYLERAAAADAESNRAFEGSREAVSGIPMGQPILVGHHSEGRHRRDLARADNRMRQSVAASDKAAYYRAKAEGVNHAGISSDDPDAADKLKAKLENCQFDQERMKAANKIIRKHKTDEDRRAALVAMGYSESEAETLLTPDRVHGTGYPSYALTNNNSNMRRIAKRIEELAATENREDREEEGNGYTYREDTGEHRVMFEFDGKPDAAIRTVLKSHGFKWSPSRMAWVRQLNGNGLYAAKMVRAKLDAG